MQHLLLQFVLHLHQEGHLQCLQVDHLQCHQEDHPQCLLVALQCLQEIQVLQLLVRPHLQCLPAQLHLQLGCRLLRRLLGGLQLHMERPRRQELLLQVRLRYQ